MSELMDVINAFGTPLKIAWVGWMAWGVGQYFWFRHERSGLSIRKPAAVAKAAVKKPAVPKPVAVQAAEAPVVGRLFTPTHVQADAKPSPAIVPVRRRRYRFRSLLLLTQRRCSIRQRQSSRPSAPPRTRARSTSSSGISKCRMRVHVGGETVRRRRLRTAQRRRKLHSPPATTNEGWVSTVAPVRAGKAHPSSPLLRSS